MERGRYCCMLAITVILAVVRVSPAQEDTWSTGGPYDASVYSIAIDPTDSMHLYIGTLEDFVYQTTNGGAEWSTVSIEDSPDVFIRQMVRSVNIHPFGPDTMFIATVCGAYKSVDAGETWSQMFPQWPDRNWNVSEINHANPPVLFLGTAGSAWRSTDSGRNWTQMPYLTGDIKRIKADPVNPNIIYAANNTTIPNASIWKSTNAGLIWQNIHHNLQRFNIDRPVYGRGIEVDPVDPDIVYFSRHSFWDLETDTILVKSTDGGESWIDITPRDLLDSYYLHGVVVSPLDHNTVLLCTDADGVLRSTDGGATWEDANQGIMGKSHRAMSLTADPRTGFIYHGRWAGGIYRSTDDGQSWEKISYNITAAQVVDMALNRRHPDTLFAGTANGLYMSTDGAASWEFVEFNIPDDGHFGGNYVEVDPYDPSYVYAGYYGALYRSTDGGATWESFSQGLSPGISYRYIEVADFGGGSRRLFLGSWRGLFFSDDLGESWSRCGNGIPAYIEIADVAVSPVDSFVVFAGDWLGGLYRSEDAGETWELTNSPIEIQEIACDPMIADIIYITTGHISVEGRIYKSTDGGWSWREISNDIPGHHTFTGLAINPLNHDNVFVWPCGRGIFQSHDGGRSWEDFNFGLEQRQALACTLIDPVDTSRVFLGIYGGSVWTITRTQTGIGEDPEYIEPMAFFSSSYPNPFNPSATIEYSLPEAAFVTVDIYDLLGRKMERIVGEDQRAGNYRVVWDAKDRASGVYFYRINAGEISDMRKMILLK